MKRTVILATALLLSACAHQDQNTYKASEVGKPTTVEFGTVLLERQVDIVGENTGTGAAAGAVGGGLIGAVGSGSVGWTIASALGGAVVGAVGEQVINNRVGIEYTITLKNRKTIVVTQNQGDKDQVFQPGAAIMVQTTGNYQRVLSADKLPEVIEKPKSVHIKKKALSKDLEPDDEDNADDNH